MTENKSKSTDTTGDNKKKTTTTTKTARQNNKKKEVNKKWKQLNDGVDKFMETHGWLTRQDTFNLIDSFLADPPMDKILFVSGMNSETIYYGSLFHAVRNQCNILPLGEKLTYDKKMIREDDCGAIHFRGDGFVLFKSKEDAEKCFEILSDPKKKFRVGNTYPKISKFRCHDLRLPIFADNNIIKMARTSPFFTGEYGTASANDGGDLTEKNKELIEQNKLLIAENNKSKALIAENKKLSSDIKLMGNENMMLNAQMIEKQNELETVKANYNKLISSKENNIVNDYSNIVNEFKAKFEELKQAYDDLLIEKKALTLQLRKYMEQNGGSGGVDAKSPFLDFNTFTKDMFKDKKN